jgi:ADP-dependent NAD(P)H-hydrate dehydratase / NAD(P)H-hydrate epimerase
VKIVSVAQMRALEAAAFEQGITEVVLQERAGHAVAAEAFRLLQPHERVVVLVGHGNNGRDGAVAAKWLLGRGIPVDLVLAPRHALTVEELAAIQASGGTLTPREHDEGVEHALSGARLAVDALTGIGARGALREPLASLARVLNASRARRGEALHVMALDIPSGIDADTGAVPGDAVWADSTVTLGGVKQGLLRFPAAEHVGTLIPRSIGLPPSAEADLPYSVCDPAELGQLVPKRPLDAHKYRFGRALVVAGADYYPGAPVLCAGGAARIGAGLVTLASTCEVRHAVAAHFPEITYTRDEVRAADGPDQIASLQPYLESHTSIVLGPGLGRGPSITAFVQRLLAARPREHSLVVDADGLVALAELPRWPTLLGSNVVLTPHAGELQRLVGHQLDDDEPAWVQAGRLATEWSCVLVAKGPFTSIARADGRVDVWPRANPALATGGTGDVLAGVCAGLLAQGMPAADAAGLAVGVHGVAAERLIRHRRWRTLLASDILNELPAALDELYRAAPTRLR